MIVVRIYGNDGIYPIVWYVMEAKKQKTVGHSLLLSFKNDLGDFSQ